MESREIFIAVFISGACAMMVEIGGGKIIAPYLGTTIYTWAAVIGFVLAALSAGYYLGGVLAERYNDRKHLGNVFFLAAFCTVLIPILAYIIVPLTTLLPLAWASILSAMILVPASVFFGMVSPYAIKLVSRERESGKMSGQVFALSTFGSIIGTLGTGFILIPNISITLIFVGAGAAMFLTSFLVSRKIEGIDALMFLAFASFSSFITFSPLVQGTTIFQTESEYYAISVLDNVSIGNSTGRVLFMDGSGSSGELPDGSSLFEYETEVKKLYPLLDNPKRALVIGVGAGTQIEDLKKEFSNIMVDGVEIDPMIPEVGSKFFHLKFDNRTNIIVDDGRRFVKTISRKYDIVVLDVFRGRSVPYHLTSIEFVKELKNVTNPDAVIIMNLISAVEGDKSRFLQLVYNTYSTEFSNVYIMPLGDRPEKSQNIIMVASDADLSGRLAGNPRVIVFKLATSQIVTDDLNPVEVLVQ
jgi:spermidine synthase